MSFLIESLPALGKAPDTAIVLVNLGTPDAPTRRAVHRYLKQFLSDPRVVEMPRAVWWPILHLAVLPLRCGKSAAKYKAIWEEKGSPLRIHTERQSRLLALAMGRRGYKVRVVHAMRYGKPSVADVLHDIKEEGCSKVLILPAYPQYAGATTASLFDAVFAHYRQVRDVPELRFVKHYHDHEAYVYALRQSVLAHWELAGKPEKLLMNFHGLPKRAMERGDPYFHQCQQTARLLADALELSAKEYLVTFQSRFGKAQWLQPYTVPALRQLAREGVRRVDVVCPSFTSDCLETLEEIAIRLRQDFLQAGGEVFHYIPCLNEDEAWIAALADIAEQHLTDWAIRLPIRRESSAGKRTKATTFPIAVNI